MNIWVTNWRNELDVWGGMGIIAWDSHIQLPEAACIHILLALLHKSFVIEMVSDVADECSEHMLTYITGAIYLHMLFHLCLSSLQSNDLDHHHSVAQGATEPR